MSEEAVPLTCYRQGEDVTIEWLGLDDVQAQRLRDIGVREGCRVCVMMNADKCILGIGTCRVALRREVAMNLFAVPFAEAR
ncbi:MAG: FeoA family protein [Rhodothermales bacterium]